MEEFLRVIFDFPTVIFTVMLGVSSLYWLTVFMGLLDIDLIDVGEFDVMDGAIDGAIDGALEGAADGVADGAADGAADALDAAEGGGGLTRFLFNALGVQQVPLTFSLSMLSLWSWLLSALASQYLAPLVGRFVNTIVFAVIVFFVALIISLLITKQLVKPFAKLFETEEAVSKLTLVGKLCTITTNSVDERFGQAECKDGGAGLILQVRYGGSEGPSKGQQAVLVDYDHARDVYVIEPIDTDDGLGSATSAPPVPRIPTT